MAPGDIEEIPRALGGEKEKAVAPQFTNYLAPCLGLEPVTGYVMVG